MIANYRERRSHWTSHLFAGMVIGMDNLTPLGELLEAARGSMSKRAAARAAEISDARWRQVVTGVQKAGHGIEIPVNPSRKTVRAMAKAVGVDVNRALVAAGYEPEATLPAGDDGDATFAAIDADPKYASDEDRERVKALIRLFRDGDTGGTHGASDNDSAAGGR